LENLPYPSINNKAEEMARNAFLAIGYRGLARNMAAGLLSDLEIKVNKSNVCGEVGEAADIISKVNQLKLNNLKAYEELGTVEELQFKIDSESRIDELESRLEELEIMEKRMDYMERDIKSIPSV